MQKITPFLWFDHQAEEAARFYTWIFPDSKIDQISLYGETEHGQKGTVMMVTFTLNGQEFMALNGGPIYSFTPAISLYVNCKDQAEVDWYWDKLSAGGQVVECGWLTDKYGISWQIVPEILGTLMSDPDRQKADRAMQALLKMKKLDVSLLQKAFNG